MKTNNTDWGRFIEHRPYFREMSEKDWQALKEFVNSQKAEILDEVKKVKNRYRCGACDSKISNLSHTMCCEALTNVIKLLTEMKGK